MRHSPATAFVLAAAGLLQAFPFVVGRSMEYSVHRGWGTERSLVTLTPLEIAEDSTGRYWKILMNDSLVAGKRTKSVVESTMLELRVDDTSMAWTYLDCQVPWDLGDHWTNVPPALIRGFRTLPWGARALRCANVVGVYSIGPTTRNVVDDHPCDEKVMSCITYRYSWAFPIPGGIWSDDSGWISYQDGDIGESWILTRIGGGAGVPEGRYRPEPRLVRVGYRWTWRRVVDWSRRQMMQTGLDSSAGSDTTWIEWTAIERLGDTGRVGTWSFSRTARGKDRREDRVVVDFDSPFARTDVQKPEDLDLAIFRREAKPDKVGVFGYAYFAWSRSSSGSTWMTSYDVRRTYEFSPDGSVARMVEVRPQGNSGQSLLLSRCDTTVTLSLLSRDSATPSSMELRPARMARLRTISDLERIVAEGGRILSVRDLRGKRLDGVPGSALEVAWKARGILLVEARTADGVLLRMRILATRVAVPVVESP